MIDELSPRPIGSTVKEGIIFWERGRLWWNGTLLVMTLVAILFVDSGTQYFWKHFSTYFENVLIANVLYCGVYGLEFLWLIPAIQHHAIGIRRTFFTFWTLFACFFAFLTLAPRG